MPVSAASGASVAAAAVSGRTTSVPFGTPRIAVFFPHPPILHLSGRRFCSSHRNSAPLAVPSGIWRSGDRSRRSNRRRQPVAQTRAVRNPRRQTRSAVYAVQQQSAGSSRGDRRRNCVGAGGNSPGVP